MTAAVQVIGAGLAGSEAAWQCARRGVAVELWEMRPVRSTPAHQTADFAELVCSNSLKSDSENTAPWLLKEEMRRAGSLLLEIARECAVPAGHALAVDRASFRRPSHGSASPREPLITIRREEVTQINVDQTSDDQITIIATGPLTSDALSQEIARLSGSTHLYFFDSISPIVEADSIDMSKVYLAARYDKGSADYINCPMSKEEYDRFCDALISGRIGRGARLGEAELFRRLPAHRRNCPPRPRHAALRSHEAGGLERSAHRADSLRRGAAAAGKSARRFLQPGRLSESPEIRRPGPRAAPDSRAGERALPALRADSSQHLHQRADAVARDAADEGASRSVLSPDRFAEWKATSNRSPPA